MDSSGPNSELNSVSQRDSRSVIALYHLSLRYGEQLALDDVSFSVANGEFVFIVGPSGAGKSSILRLITMDDFPTSGEIIVGSFLSSRIKRKQIPLLRREVGVVFQDFRLLEDRSVEDNVAFAQLVIGVPRAEAKRNVAQILNSVGLYHKRGQIARTLSGGEQQRVAIARAVVNRPKILLADEPTGNLDPEVSQDVIDLLFRINAGGTAVVMSTHDHLMVRQYGERIIALQDGKIASDMERYRAKPQTDRRVVAERLIRKDEDIYRPRTIPMWESEADTTPMKTVKTDV